MFLLFGPLGWAACTGRQRATNLSTSLRISPPAPAVGAGTLVELGLFARTEPVTGAALRIEAHMTHPGMAPVIAPMADKGSGKYETTLRFNMAGDWVLFAKGTLADRQAFDRRLTEVTVSPVR